MWRLFRRELIWPRFPAALNWNVRPWATPMRWRSREALTGTRWRPRWRKSWRIKRSWNSIPWSLPCAICRRTGRWRQIWPGRPSPAIRVRHLRSMTGPSSAAVRITAPAARPMCLPAWSPSRCTWKRPWEAREKSPPRTPRRRKFRRLSAGRRAGTALSLLPATPTCSGVSWLWPRLWRSWASP